MKPNIYAGQLNTERIAKYQKLAEDYYIEEGTVGRIFCDGANWGLDVATRDQIEKPMCFPNECDHPREKRTFYEGGSSWCNKCWSYVDMPPSIADCKHFDQAQGRNKCLRPRKGTGFFSSHRCDGICAFFDKK
jgi:hypothetical protein